MSESQLFSQNDDNPCGSSAGRADVSGNPRISPNQFQTSKALLGAPTVEMLLKVHEDALWVLENLGVGCKQPDML
ncbi:MAG: hypothetical protein PVG01_05200, partial [Desulfobacterales bacterium]